MVQYIKMSCDRTQSGGDIIILVCIVTDRGNMFCFGLENKLHINNVNVPVN